MAIRVPKFVRDLLGVATPEAGKLLSWDAGGNVVNADPVSADPTFNSLTTTAPTGQAGLTLASGSRIYLDGGATRYIEWNGASFGLNGPISVGNSNVVAGSIYPGATATLNLRGRASDGSSAVGIKVGNINTLNNSTAKIVAFYSDDLATERASINSSGTLSLNQGTGMLNAQFVSAAGANNQPLYLSGNTSDAASAVGVYIQSIVNLTTAGAKVAAFRVNAVEKFAIGKDGDLRFVSAAPASPVDGMLWFDGTNLKFRTGGVTKTVTLA